MCRYPSLASTYRRRTGRIDRGYNRCSADCVGADKSLSFARLLRLFRLPLEVRLPRNLSRLKVNCEDVVGGAARMASVWGPSAVFTPVTINGSRNHCIPTVFSVNLRLP